MDSINALRISDDLISKSRSFGKSITSEMTTLCSIQKQTQTRLFHVKCHLRLLDLKQEMVRKFCNYCKRITATEIGAVYTCNYCEKSNATCLLGFRVDVIASDMTGNLPVTLYENDASLLLNCTLDMTGNLPVTL